MKSLTLVRRPVVMLSLLALLSSQFVQAAGPPSAGGTVCDVALSPARVLAGQLIDASGVPVANAAVRLVVDGSPIAAARTDADGRFGLSGITPGVYQLETPTSSTVCRVWAPNTAPPSARPALLLVSGQDLVRQQNAFSALANPWVLGAIVAAAIAIPLALDDDDDDSSS